MWKQNVCIAVVEDHQQAQAAVDALCEAGFDKKRISVVGKDHPSDQHVHGYWTTGDEVKFWGVQGAFWGGIIGTLAGAGVFFVPGIGPLMVGGPLVSMMVGGLEGSAGLAGIEAVFAGLLHLGLSKDGLVLYEKELKAGKIFVLVHGNTSDVLRAQDILNDAGCAVVSVHAE